MAQISDPGVDTIRFERVYDASIEGVWALWTTKEGLEEWFAPEGMHVEVLALELRVGGAFDHVMTAVGVEQVAYMANVNRPPTARVSGRFVEIVRHRRLDGQVESLQLAGQSKDHATLEVADAAELPYLRRRSSGPARATHEPDRRHRLSLPSAWAAPPASCRPFPQLDPSQRSPS